MEIQLHRLVMPITDPFTIARGTITEQESLVVELIDGQLHGWGEVTVNDYYGHTFDSLSASLQLVKPLLNRYRSESPETVWADALGQMNGDRFAMAALDLAAHDLWGKRHDLPCFKQWGLPWGDVPSSSYTIGIDTIERMLEKLHAKPGWPIYKIKLGTQNDLEIVRTLRRHTDAVLRVDANCGWTVQQTIDYSAELKTLGVEFIEQPLPAEASREDKRAVFEGSALPLIADESCRTESDVADCRDLFHGINVKLCKCGGLTAALQMLRQARQWGMKTMVGCMVESSIGISAGAHLLPLLDYADLDGAVLLKADPAVGVHLDHGHFSQPSAPGLSASLRA